MQKIILLSDFWSQALRSLLTSRRGPSFSEADIVYLASLLNNMISRDVGLFPGEERAMCIQLDEIRRSSDRINRSLQLQNFGDTVLFMMAAFSERLVRRGVPLTYYSEIGSSAYLGAVASNAAGKQAKILSDLASRYSEASLLIRDALHSIDKTGMAWKAR